MEHLFFHSGRSNRKKRDYLTINGLKSLHGPDEDKSVVVSTLP